MNLPPSERKEFIEEFWNRRDPDPDTEENEFKNAYEARIKKANELFGVGQAGFYTDRGMIYVLFGPPDDIHQSQIFTRRAGADQQVWLYSKVINKYPNVRISFVDQFGTDDYELVRSSSIYSILQEAKLYYLNMATKKRYFAYVVNLVMLKEEKNKVDFKIQVKVPYKNIWFSSSEDKMKVTLSLKIEVADSSYNKIWEFKKAYSISLREKEIIDLYGKEYLIEIPMTLKRGKYSLQVNLVTQTGEEGRKVLEINI
jgi:GWxTD domain-containing protein